MRRASSRLGALSAAALLAGLCGCAAFQSSRRVETDPSNSAQQIVTTKKCQADLYPFAFAVSFFDIFPESESATRKDHIMGDVTLAPVTVPLGLALDAITMPYEIYAGLFTSSCTTTVAIQETPAHKWELVAQQAAQAGRPARLSVERLAFHDPSGRGVLQGGDGGTITFTISNGRGAGSSVDLEASVTAEPHLYGLRIANTKIGDLAAGAVRAVTIPLEAADDLPNGEVVFRIAFKEAKGNPPDPLQVRVRTLRLSPPRFKIARLELDDRTYDQGDEGHLSVGNGNGTWEPGEAVELYVTLLNEGGQADHVSVSLIGDDGKDLRLLEAGKFKRHVDIGGLAPGQKIRVPFALSLDRLYRGKAQLPLAVAVSERRKRFDTTLPLDVKIGERIARPQLLEVQPAIAATTRAAGDDVDTPPNARTPTNPDSVAVVIGVEHYRQKGIPAVDFAALDAQAVYDYLTRAMGYDPKNVVLLKNDQATKGDLEKFLGAWLENHVSERSRVFVYFAGHGTPDPRTGQAYLVPYDGDPAYTASTAYPVRRLYRTLAKLPTKDVTVALDSCFSGAGGRSILAEGTRPLVSIKDDPEGIGANTIVMAAARGDQISGTDPEAQHGLLTYFLLKGLKGAADFHHDGSITTAELFAYVEPSVERAARLQNIEQDPVLTPPVHDLGRRAERPWLVLERREGGRQ